MTNEDPLGVRDDFPVTKSRTYLNTPYAGPVSRAVRDTAIEYANEKLDWAASRTSWRTKSWPAARLPTFSGSKPKRWRFFTRPVTARTS